MYTRICLGMLNDLLYIIKWEFYSITYYFDTATLSTRYNAMCTATRNIAEARKYASQREGGSVVRNTEKETEANEGIVQKEERKPERMNDERVKQLTKCHAPSATVLENQHTDHTSCIRRVLHNFIKSAF